MNSHQLASGNVEQVLNPWRSDQDSTATARGRQRGDADAVFRDDAPGLATWQDRDMILSPTPPPQSTEPIHSPLMQETDTPTDPHIASLKAIFPDFDDAVIISVLDSTDNDHDRALDVLLGMSDPSFVPPELPPSQVPNEFQSPPSTDAQRLSQEALDEQLARRLALEEQQAATQAWQPPQAWEGQTMYQPYQPRRGGSSWNGQPQTQSQGGRDTITEFQEGFNRIAESGKKTFSSIVSKVKAKMQEFDQGQGWSGSQNPPPGQSQQSGAPYYPSYPSGQQQGPVQGTYAQPYQPTQPADLQRQSSQSQPARTSPYPSSPPRSGVSQSPATGPAPAPGPQQASYYDPNTRGYDLYGDGDEDEIQIMDNRTPSTVVAAASATTQNSATPPQTDRTATPPPPSETSSSLPSYTSLASSLPNSSSPPSSTSPPARSLSPAITGAKGTTPSMPGGVDFSKLGLLPKRPISLVRPQSPPAAGAGTGAGAGTSVTAPCVAVAHSESSSTDREELEFVENPFEDQ